MHSAESITSRISSLWTCKILHFLLRQARCHGEWMSSLSQQNWHGSSTIQLMWEQVAGWNSVGTSHDLIRLHCYCCCSLHLDNKPMSNSALFYYAYIWYIAHVLWDNHFLVHWCFTIIAVCVTCTDRKVLQLYFGLILIWSITFTVRQNPPLRFGPPKSSPSNSGLWSFLVLQIPGPAKSVTS